ncbi:DUF6191 domain-containing protein [Pseudonocardia kujensis]|uniref:DUF6191 domain-containing protein n=1 Tax=Pseudonocardia kujensis TaxID=1128675 RepID=UPI001E2904F8|nr:DUF6191 domain-containing protein [Pseudonocardia kujensis]MCE0768489.1 DUF6191 domain-containing protein [Pseudonocardia kujensis]
MAAGVLFALTLPGLVCLLVLFVALERFGLWARGHSLLFWRRDQERSGPQSLPLSGAGFEEVDAFFTGAKRAELEERHSRSLLREDEADGAPPRPAVDLDAGVVTVFRRPR